MYSNKDGLYAWRPLQLINPVLYIGLVDKITTESDWSIIVDRFKVFQKNEKIECHSIPLVMEHPNSKQDTILNWWEEIEQRSIELALDYKCALVTDITDCYGSMYTHVISWAIHGESSAKERMREGGTAKKIGDKIDSLIQYMSYNQTNGIPQGSVLMDFIAEMVLGYADLLLLDKIEEYNKNAHDKIVDYRILRYRDDYRIFGNSHEQLVRIAKMLTEVLQHLNLRINTQKTYLTDCIVKDSIKPDKYFWNEMHQDYKNLQKQLLLIHSMAVRYPNSGTLVRLLADFCRTIQPLEVYKAGSIKVLVSIIVDIARKCPRGYHWVCSIIGKLLSLEMNVDEKRSIYQSVKKRFEEVPNTGLLDIWLQRMTMKINEKEVYNELLCKIVSDTENKSIWGIEWIPDSLRRVFEDNPIVDKSIIDEMDEIPSLEELKSFKLINY